MVNTTGMRIALVLAAAGVLTAAAASIPLGPGQDQARSTPRELLVRSPDGRTIVTVNAGDQLRWSATRDGRPIVADCSAGLTIDGRALGRGAVRDVREGSADEMVSTTFYARRRRVRDRYRQLTVALDDGLTLVMRAYDDGIAYRLATEVDRTVRIDADRPRNRPLGQLRTLVEAVRKLAVGPVRRAVRERHQRRLDPARQRNREIEAGDVGLTVGGPRRDVGAGRARVRWICRAAPVLCAADARHQQHRE